uniref:Uncharacterized protein n=1 Tax=Arundo donax TaxID=35708 RepID=A0A0A9BKI5_ARUDO
MNKTQKNLKERCPHTQILHMNFSDSSHAEPKFVHNTKEKKSRPN